MCSRVIAFSTKYKRQGTIGSKEGTTRIDKRQRSSLWLLGREKLRLLCAVTNRNLLPTCCQSTSRVQVMIPVELLRRKHLGRTPPECFASKWRRKRPKNSKKLSLKWKHTYSNAKIRFCLTKFVIRAKSWLPRLALWRLGELALSSGVVPFRHGAWAKDELGCKQTLNESKQNSNDAFCKSTTSLFAAPDVSISTLRSHTSAFVLFVLCTVKTSCKRSSSWHYNANHLPG